MLYDYQYDVVALIATAYLLVLYMIRRSYKTKSNWILFALIASNFLATITDLASCFTISYPNQYSILFCNLTALGYLACYNLTGLLFFLYVDSRAKVEFMYKKSYWIAGIVGTIETLLILSSPWTHLVAYFDPNRIYQHGPLVGVLYGVAVLIMLGSIALFILGINHFNLYQVVAVIAFILCELFCVLFQLKYPRVLIGQAGATLVLFFIYNAFENPAYFTYRDTRCFNRAAFTETLKRYIRKDTQYCVLGITIKDFDFLRDNLTRKNLIRLNRNVCEFLYKNFIDYAYYLEDGKFALVFKPDKGLGIKNVPIEDQVKNAIMMLDTFCAKPVQLGNKEQNINMSYMLIDDLDGSIDVEAIDGGLVSMMDSPDADQKSAEDLLKRSEKLSRQSSISHALLAAVRGRKFIVFYQPIRNVKTGTFTSMEALVRLQDMDFGFISPEEFIPIAEKEGLICDIGEMVFEQVCKFMHERKITELGVEYVEINLSPIQCFQKDLVEKFSAIMEQYEIDPHWINLEITESAQFTQDDTMHNNINRLHEMGVTFSLDDYGSGFASADYLFKLPVRIVKIDKTILWNAMNDKNAMIVLCNTMKMLHELGKYIVVEGVENQEMIDVLVANDCDYMQGYFYSKPISGNDYYRFIKKSIEKKNSVDTPGA